MLDKGRRVNDGTIVKHYYVLMVDGKQYFFSCGSGLSISVDHSSKYREVVG